MATREDVAKMVAMLQAAFPNWKLSEYTIEVYYMDLQDIPAAELLTASQYCRTQAGRAFAPSTGELRGAVMDLRRKTMSLPSGYEAWQEVLRQINVVGVYGVPEWSSPLIEKAVKSLGWRNLCMSENQTADRARFLQAFEQLTQRAETEMMLTPNVRDYLEANGAQLLPVGEQVKQLAEGMKK